MASLLYVHAWVRPRTISDKLRLFHQLPLQKQDFAMTNELQTSLGFLLFFSHPSLLVTSLNNPSRGAYCKLQERVRVTRRIFGAF